MSLVGGILYALLWVALVLLIARIVLEYVQMFARDWRPHGPALVAAELVYTATDPPIRALRRVLPPLRIGAVAFDLAFPILFLLVLVLMRLVVLIP